MIVFAEALVYIFGMFFVDSYVVYVKLCGLNYTGTAWNARFPPDY